MLKDHTLLLLIVMDLAVLGLLILQGLGLITPTAPRFHYEAPFLYVGYFATITFMIVMRICFRKGREEEEEQNNDGSGGGPRGRIR